MEEELERLCARRRMAKHSHHHHGHVLHRDAFSGGVSPLESTFSVDSNVVLGSWVMTSAAGTGFRSSMDISV